MKAEEAVKGGLEDDLTALRDVEAISGEPRDGDLVAPTCSARRAMQVRGAMPSAMLAAPAYMTRFRSTKRFGCFA